MKLEDLAKINALIAYAIQLKQLVETTAVRLTPDGGFVGSREDVWASDAKSRALITDIKKATHKEFDRVRAQLKELGVDVPELAFFEA